jgi:ferric-dicitrate binding protein FerR (iron transport regulator)
LKETAWVYNKLVFEGDHFDELAIKLERWYDVHIHFTQEQLKQYRFKGAFETETIAQALDALRLTAPFEYSIYGNDIEITPPTSKGN